MSLWRNRLARSAVNRKVGGSSPPRDAIFLKLKARSWLIVKCTILPWERNPDFEVVLILY
ncbi:hypothetical protein ScPMuIL_005178, partial [Solemya velum]